MLTLLIALLPLEAGAFDNALTGVRADWARYDMIWQTAGRTHETRLSRLVVVLDEQPWPRVYGGLRAGYVDLSQADNPAAAGLDLHGYSLGVRFGAFLVRGRFVDVFVQADHDYLQARDTLDEQRTEFDWTETRFKLGATVKLGRFRLSGAAYRDRVDGDRRQRGPVNRTVRFSETERGGTSAGIELQVDPTGYIGFYAESGARDGIRLTFAREF